MKYFRYIFLGSLIFSFANHGNALTLNEIMASKKEVPKAIVPSPKKGKEGFIFEPQKDITKETVFFTFKSIKEKVEGKIQEELKEKYGQNIEVNFISWHLPGVKRSLTSPVNKFIVEEIEVNKQRTAISALVHFQIKGALKTLRIRGRLDYMIEVPALNRPVHYGEIIKKEDIGWTKVSSRKSNQFLIISPKDLIGRQPKRGFLKVNMPLYKRDVEQVKDIQKGSMVTAVYKTDKLELITKVRALENGYKGSTIRILNPDTNKILYGIVLGPNRISLNQAQ